MLAETSKKLTMKNLFIDFIDFIMQINFLFYWYLFFYVKKYSFIFIMFIMVEVVYSYLTSILNYLLDIVSAVSERLFSIKIQNHTFVFDYQIVFIFIYYVYLLTISIAFILFLPLFLVKYNKNIRKYSVNSMSIEKSINDSSRTTKKELSLLRILFVRNPETLNRFKKETRMK